MVVSKKIISQWVDVKKIKDQEIAKALNSLGFEVDKIVNLVNANTNLIVGEIIKIEEHPKSNKLNLCYVNIGKKIIKIICGASNVRVGIKVVVAQVGAKLANGMVIVPREILGMFSNGMICSLQELGLNQEVLTEQELEGIVHLPQQALVGSLSPLNYLELDDSIFEIQLTVNRNDCLAMYYIAKELSNYFNLSLSSIAISTFKDIKIVKKQQPDFVSALGLLRINLKDENKINETWIKRTLQLTNIKPKSFFDDLINFVMLELGQPLVGFAGQNLQDFKIELAKKDYISDNFQYFKNDILFSNKKEFFSNLAISTLSDYFISSTTKSILFVSLNLNNNLVQQQIKRNLFNTNNLILQRLNKELVPINYLIALSRILFLLEEFKINFEVVSFISELEYKHKEKEYTINYNIINQLLGTNLSLDKIIETLKVIDCEIKKTDKSEALTIKIPDYRTDLKNVNDFAEEIARMIGYNNLPTQKPKFIINPIDTTYIVTLLESMRSYLLHHGFHQVKTYSLTNKESLLDFNFFGYKKPISLISAINVSRTYMRFSLVPSLLEICKLNSSYKKNNLRVFSDEVIYNNQDDIETRNNHHLSFVINNDFFTSNKNITTKSADNFLLIKGLFEAWLLKESNPLFIDDLLYHPFESSCVHPYLSSEVKYNNIHFATISALHPKVSFSMSLSQEVFFVEINFTRLANILNSLKNINKNIKFQNWSKFNPLSRDLSIIIKQDIDYASIKNAILATKTKYLESITLIDVYSDVNMKLKKKYSLTFNLEFNCKKMQLDEEKVSQEIKLIEQMLITKFQATIR